MGLRLRAGCKVWQGEFEINGVRHSFSTGETVKSAAAQHLRDRRRRIEAQLAAQAAERAARAEGRTPDPQLLLLADGGEHSVKRMFKEYWETIGSFTVSKDALKQQMKRMLGIVEKLFGPDAIMTAIDDFAMLKIKAELKRQGPLYDRKDRSRRRNKWGKKEISSGKEDEASKYAASSSNDYLQIPFRVWNFAHEVRGMRPQHELHPKRWLDPEPVETREMGLFEEAKLHAVCLQRRPELIPVYRFGIQTMVRREELCTLTWNQVDWEHRQITVLLKGPGEEKKEHRVYLNDEALQILRSVRGHHPKFCFTLKLDGDRTVAGKRVPAGQRIPLRPQRFAALLRECFDAVELFDLRAGHLRHTGATRLLRLCGSLEVVRKVLGHTTTKCTQRYAAMVDADVENALQLLGKIMPKARDMAMKAMKKPDVDEVRASLDLCAKFDRKALSAATEQLRKDANAAMFTYATAVHKRAA